MENTLDILHIERKGPLMNTPKRFHIYKLSKENMHMNDTYADTYNPIFNLITKYYKKYHTDPTPPTNTTASPLAHPHYSTQLKIHTTKNILSPPTSQPGTKIT
jgi:hypothetical protein